MTEYGRGRGSEPWHPEDPLYGDGGWGGQQAHDAQSSYGGQPQHYPEQPLSQQHYGGWENGTQPGHGQDQQQYTQQYQQQYQQEYGGQYDRQYDQQYAAQAQHQNGNGGWAPGAQYPDPEDPYGQQPAAGYGSGQSDYYGTPDAYPPPEPPGRRRPEPEPDDTGWDPGPDQGEHAFFAGGDDGGDDEGGGGRGARRSGRAGKSKKGRNGIACLVVCLVLGGGVLGVGYFGYQFYQDRFGAAPDFAGDGNGEQITVTIPKGAGGSVIGQELKRKGVVKSVDAFVAALQSNPDAKSIQDGVYTLEKEMSARSAVELMLSPESRNNLIIAEGKRNADIYQLIDTRLELDKGTTAQVAKDEYKNLGLPEWAMNRKNVKDPLEGFLYPSSYAVAKGQEPGEVLKQMVRRAGEKYQALGLEQKAEGLGLDGPWQLLTVASLVQAEGRSHEDFRKMAEVIYNRQKPNPQTNGMLEFDSTYNYIKNQSKIDLTLKELRTYDNPYNTYYYKGLPPGPISNPGEDALKGALDPTDDGWYYFISLDGKTSKFTRTNAEHEELVKEFNKSRNQ
ncbi:endolytic transglycosylase MltG [Streptomyces poriticola]|uniref:endolytic transglycosylase MltG n=1 Tax=Streptomyces poriticola TaxID=3120506 RepID=UPI002FCE3FA5